LKVPFGITVEPPSVRVLVPRLTVPTPLSVPNCALVLTLTVVARLLLTLTWVRVPRAVALLRFTTFWSLLNLAPSDRTEETFRFSVTLPVLSMNCGPVPVASLKPVPVMFNTLLPWMTAEEELEPSWSRRRVPVSLHGLRFSGRFAGDEIEEKCAKLVFASFVGSDRPLARGRRAAGRDVVGVGVRRARRAVEVDAAKLEGEM